MSISHSSLVASKRAEKNCCPACGQQLPPKERFNIKVMSQGVHYHGKFARLSPYELRIFELLLRVAPQPVVRDRIFSLLYADDPDGGPTGRPIDALVHNLRRKLKKIGLHVDSYRWVGWWLRVPLGEMDDLDDFKHFRKRSAP